MKNLKKIVLVLIFMLFIFSCASNVDKVEQLQQETQDNLLAIADLAYAEKQYDIALETYNAILKYHFDTAPPEVYLKLADIYHQQERFAEEVDIYYKLIEKYPREEYITQVYFKLAQIYNYGTKRLSPFQIDTTDFRRAVDYYEKVITRADTISQIVLIANAYYEMADAYQQLGDSLKIAEIYDTLVKKYPNTEWARKAHEKLGTPGLMPLIPLIPKKKEPPPKPKEEKKEEGPPPPTSPLSKDNKDKKTDTKGKSDKDKKDSKKKDDKKTDKKKKESPK
jgi:tetratricopeptide (TPR) repeat protein